MKRETSKVKTSWRTRCARAIRFLFLSCLLVAAVATSLLWITLANRPAPNDLLKGEYHRLYVGLNPVCESIHSGFEHGRAFVAATLFQSEMWFAQLDVHVDHNRSTDEDALTIVIDYPMPRGCPRINKWISVLGLGFGMSNAARCTVCGVAFDGFEESQRLQREGRESRTSQRGMLQMRIDVTIPLWMVLFTTGVMPLTYLLISPMWRWRRRKRGLCVSCGYNLQGNVSGVCSECGLAATDRSVTK